MSNWLSKKMAEKMGRGVHEASEPIRTELKKTVDNKVDIYSKIVKLCVLIFLFIDGSKRVVNAQNEPSSPNHIIINNYINQAEKEGDG